MSARLLRGAWVIATALALAACGKEPAAPAAQVPAAQASAAAPAQPAALAKATTSDSASQEQATPQPPAPESPAPATAQAETLPAPEAGGPEPKEGVDYQYIDPPQPLNQSPGTIEVAEVFSYTCIHCARLDPLIATWKATLPEKAKFVAVPTSYGAFEQIARAFYASQALGEQEKVHAALFKAMAEDHKIKSGSAEEVIGLYKDLGVDEQALAAAMKSFSVNAQIARSQKTLPRWGIEATPTLVVAGKYRVLTTAEGGHQGAMRTARWLVDKELAAQAPAQN